MKKATGIVRKTDNLGRITLPVEIRRMLDVGDSVEIWAEGDSIMLRKFQLSCMFCDGTKGVTMFKDKLICYKCRIDMSNSVDA